MKRCLASGASSDAPHRPPLEDPGIGLYERPIDRRGCAHRDHCSEADRGRWGTCRRTNAGGSARDRCGECLVKAHRHSRAARFRHRSHSAVADIASSARTDGDGRRSVRRSRGLQNGTRLGWSRRRPGDHSTWRRRSGPLPSAWHVVYARLRPAGTSPTADQSRLHAAEADCSVCPISTAFLRSDQMRATPAPHRTGALRRFRRPRQGDFALQASAGGEIVGGATGAASPKAVRPLQRGATAIEATCRTL